VVSLAKGHSLERWVPIYRLAHIVNDESGGAADGHHWSVSVSLRPLLVYTGMIFSSHSSDISTVSTVIAQAFDIAGALHSLPGGEGRTYRAGNIIYRCEANVPEASYLADVYHRWSRCRVSSSGIRTPILMTSSWS
jgi:hypothetical protein